MNSILEINTLKYLLLEHLSPSEIDYFKNNQKLYKKMYACQDNIFWIKLVIKCKELIYCFFESDCYIDYEDADSVFRNFLNVLVKGYSDTCTFILVTTVHFEQVCNCTSSELVSETTLKYVRNAMSLCAVFIRLYNIWEDKSVPFESKKWEIPKYWLTKYFYGDKVEDYIVTVFSFNDIEKIFTCKKEDVPHLYELYLKKIDPSMEYSSEYVGLTLAAARRFVKPVRQTTVDWFLGPNKPNSAQQRLWNMLELSLPPPLASKYHIVNVRKLMKNESDNHYVGVATWTSWWYDTFGVPHMVKILEAAKEVESASKRSKDFIEIDFKEAEKTKYLKFLIPMNDCKGAPLEKDTVKISSDEFLLEPYVLIQLPWNTVIFHQWLVGALVEVLQFEKNSLELRHSPLPESLVECVTKLLSLVTRLKERLELGFVILFKQAINHPKIEKNDPTCIMDNIVLPSLATLKFLTSGKAQLAVDNLKKLVSLPSQSDEQMLYINSNVYIIKNELLRKFSCSHFYANINWINYSNPFAKEICSEIVIKQIMQELNVSASLDKPSEIPNYELSDISNIFLSYCKEEFLLHSDIVKIYKLNKAINIIENMMVSNQLQVEWKIFKDSLQVSNFVKENQYKFKSENPVHICMWYALAYKKCSSYLHENPDDSHLLPNIIRLNLEICKQELLTCLQYQIIKYSNVNSIVIGNENNSSSSIITSILKSIIDVEKSKRDRNWLWNLFPKKYKQSVSLNEIELNNNCDIQSIVTECETRIGRIILNVAKNSYDVYKKRSEKYLHWTTVQYVLPCFIASYVQSTKHPRRSTNGKDVKNLLSLIHKILQYYEQSYYNWLGGVKDDNVANVSNNVKGISELILSCWYYKDQCRNLACAYIGLEIPEGFIGSQIIFHVIFELIYNSDNDDKTILLSLKSWFMKTYHFLAMLYNSCIDVWKPPIPGSQICIPELSQYYLEDCIINALQPMAEVVLGHTHRGPQILAALLLRSFLKNIRYNFKFARYRLLKCIADGNPDECVKNSLIKECQLERLITADFYKTYKKFSIELQYNGRSPILRYLPSKPKEIRLSINYFLSQKLFEIDQMVPLCTNIEYPIDYFYVAKVEKKAKKIKTKHVKTCRECSRVESDDEVFVVCEKCVTDRYPDVNYYCSVQCKESWWSKEHMAEHLEFELGLMTDYCYCRNCLKRELHEGRFLVCEKCIEVKYPRVNYFCSAKCKDKWWKLEHMAEHLEFELGLGEFAQIRTR